MSDTPTYQIKQAENGFVLIEQKLSHGRPIVHVPYSVQQEAESGINAAAYAADKLRHERKMTALLLVRKLTELFINGDAPDAKALLAARSGIEELVTASIAEIRNQTQNISEDEIKKMRDDTTPNKEIAGALRRVEALARGSA